MRLEVLSASVERLWLTRTGSVYVAARVAMRVWNDTPMPLKVKSLNMTTLFREVGTDALFEAGLH